MEIILLCLILLMLLPVQMLCMLTLFSGLPVLTYFVSGTSLQHKRVPFQDVMDVSAAQSSRSHPGVV